MKNEKKIFKIFQQLELRKKKFWSKNLKWATAHLSTSWAGRRARNTGAGVLGAGAVGRQAQARRAGVQSV